MLKVFICSSLALLASLNVYAVTTKDFDLAIPEISQFAPLVIEKELYEDGFKVPATKYYGPRYNPAAFSNYRNFNIDTSFTPNPLNIVPDEYSLVIVVNKSVRSTSNPKGQSIAIFKKDETGTHQLKHEWNVSTGLDKIVKESINTDKGKVVANVSTHTSVGLFNPWLLSRNHRSQQFNNAPMPNSVFFNGGIAIHATTQGNYGLLGKKASHGCVRLKLEQSKIVYNLVADTAQRDHEGELIKIAMTDLNTGEPLLNRYTGEPIISVKYDTLIMVIEDGSTQIFGPIESAPEGN